MANVDRNTAAPHARKPAQDVGLTPEHYIRLLLHRKWLVLGVALAVSAATIIVSHYLPNVYSSETLILVDPQKVPDTYVKSTVTGDVRNRLSTLSQQILSATRLQRIIETLNLYPEERKTLAREDVISKMRSDISVQVVSDFGASQDLQAFRISYSGKDPRLVAQVTNELASLFIEENLKAREQQATGTTEFLGNQLEEARKDLEQQEARLRDYKLKHIGEMPEQQAADLQILGQLQSQYQLEGDQLSRAQQQKVVLEAMLAQSAPVVDLDDTQPKAPKAADASGTAPARQAPAITQLSRDKTRLADLLTRYTPDHPDVKKLQKQIEQEEKKEAELAAAKAATAPVVVAANTTPKPAPPVAAAPRIAPALVAHVNPVVQSQITALDAEIVKHKQASESLEKSIKEYQAKLSQIPVREQEMTQLVRDHDISKAHYSQLLNEQLSAETATQLEIRQKGEKFEVLDPGQVAERPSKPNRTLINSAGALGGLILGILLAVASEFLGTSITSAADLSAAVAIPVLEVIPLIVTGADRRRKRRRMVLTSASALVTVLAICAVVVYRSQRF